VMGRVFHCLSAVTGLRITVLMAVTSVTAVRTVQCFTVLPCVYVSALTPEIW